jgi:hypothetical protein
MVHAGLTVVKVGGLKGQYHSENRARACYSPHSWRRGMVKVVGEMYTGSGQL